MIERLSLRNLQPHRRLDLDLGPGVTTLVGRSDVGKSSVLRALRWLCLNRPAGDGLLTQGEETVTVTVVVDGVKVGRRKGKGKNLYRLDGETFKAFGAGKVPRPVSDLLNVCPESFQGQHDGAFWLTDSPGKVAEHLNRVVALDLIDRVLGNLDKKARRAKAEARVCVERRDAARARLKALTWVGECGEELTAAEGMAEHAAGLAAGAELLGDLLDGLSQAEQAAAAVVPDLQPVEAAIAGRRAAVAQATGLDEVIAQISRTESLIDVTGVKLRHAEDQLARALQGRCPACGRE